MERLPSQYFYFPQAENQPYCGYEADPHIKTRAWIDTMLEFCFQPAFPCRTPFLYLGQQPSVDTPYCDRETLKKHILQIARTGTTFEKLDAVAVLGTLMMRHGLLADDELQGIKTWLEKNAFDVPAGTALLRFPNSRPSPAKQTIHDKHRVMTAMNGKEKRTEFHQRHAEIRKRHEPVCTGEPRASAEQPATRESHMESAKRSKRLLRLREVHARDVGRLVRQEMNRKHLREKLAFDREVYEARAVDLYSSASDTDHISPGRVNEADDFFN